MSKTALKAKPQLPKDNFMKKYEQFGRNFELDVFNTIQKDINVQFNNIPQRVKVSGH